MTQLPALLSQGIPSSEPHPGAFHGPAQGSCTAERKGCLAQVFHMKREKVGRIRGGWSCICYSFSTKRRCFHQWGVSCSSTVTLSMYKQAPGCLNGQCPLGVHMFQQLVLFGRLWNILEVELCWRRWVTGDQPWGFTAYSHFPSGLGLKSPAAYSYHCATACCLEISLHDGCVTSHWEPKWTLPALVVSYMVIATTTMKANDIQLCYYQLS